MHKFLPFIGNRSLKVISKRRGEFIVPLLPAALFDDYLEILNYVSSDCIPEKLADGRKRLRKIIYKVWPYWKRRELLRFDYSDTAHIASKLFFGESRRVVRRGEQETSSSDKTLNFEFMIAVIVSKFPGYTFENLIQLPIPVILEYFKLANQVGKYTALTEDFSAYTAGHYGGECVRNLEKAAEFLYQTEEQYDPVSYSNEEYQQSIERIKELAGKEPDMQIKL